MDDSTPYYQFSINYHPLSEEELFIQELVSYFA